MTSFSIFILQSLSTPFFFSMAVRTSVLPYPLNSLAANLYHYLELRKDEGRAAFKVISCGVEHSEVLEKPKRALRLCHTSFFPGPKATETSDKWHLRPCWMPKLFTGFTERARPRVHDPARADGHNITRIHTSTQHGKSLFGQPCSDRDVADDL